MLNGKLSQGVHSTIGRNTVILGGLDWIIFLRGRMRKKWMKKNFEYSDYLTKHDKKHYLISIKNLVGRELYDKLFYSENHM